MKMSYEVSFITDEAAKHLMKAAAEEAKKINLPASIAIVDPSGRLKAFRSLDNAPHVSLETAIKKAKTAIGFGFPTGHAWHEFKKNDPILNEGAGQLPDFILLGGGSPIMVQGKMIGAIGVSGGHYEQDEKCVKAALEALSKYE
jgi:uncharacterized protein GlcG (DUF336 family)